eukprot:7379378-Prymnesium_polylepis.1
MRLQCNIRHPDSSSLCVSSLICARGSPAGWSSVTMLAWACIRGACIAQPGGVGLAECERACAVTQQRHALERAALMDLAESTNVRGWTRNTNWLDPQRSVCDWDLVGCDESGFVKLLTLDFNNLTGTLPASLGTLDRLQDLDLEFNSLSGLIPPSLANLSSLVQLGLGGNAFGGPLPA